MTIFGPRREGFHVDLACRLLCVLITGLPCTACELFTAFDAPGESGAQCRDGIDNDGNGVTDCDEPACADTAVCHEVTVNVRTVAGGPAANQPVAFQDQNGEVLSTVMTDASGVAVGSLPAKGMVTYLVVDSDAARHLVTVTDVPLRATVDLGVSGIPGPMSALTARVSSTVGGQSVYIDRAGVLCTDSKNEVVNTTTDFSVDLDVPSSCVSQAATYAIHAERTGEFGNLTDWAIIRDIPATQAMIDVPAWRSDLGRIDLSLTAAPSCDAIPCVSFSVLTLDDRGFQYPGSHITTIGLDNRGVKSPGFSTCSDCPTDLFSYPQAFTASVLVTTLIDYGAGNGTIASVVSRLPGQPTSAVIPGDSVPPRLAPPAVDAMVSSRPLVTIGPTQSFTLATAGIAWTSGGVRHRWVFVAPAGDTRTVRAPALPPDLVAEAPPDGTGFVAPGPGVSALDLAGYGAATYEQAIAASGLHLRDRGITLPAGATTRMTAAGTPATAIP